MFNRRGFFGVAGVGIGSLFLPQKLQAESIKPTMEGFTDEDMAAIIAEYPHQSSAQITWCYCESGYESIDIKPTEPNGLRSDRYKTLWTVTGTEIYARFKNPDSGDFSKIIDIKHLNSIGIMKYISGEYDFTNYTRMKSTGSQETGWFTFGPGN